MKEILRVTNLCKTYREYSGEYKRVLSWFGLSFKPQKVHKVLQNINFSVAPGEAVGIVGQNGAGKSTLLKIITGTLRPSEGELFIGGRISAILELGMGFHPDMTGRQNVYHAAGLMGFSLKEIDNAIEELESFIEIGEYFDQPIRTYSSGMQMRVAFGVATLYRPEILIVDEALSVGDAYFQHKSMNRIKKFQKEGMTLLLVSHDKSAIQGVCDRAVLLEKGSVIKDDKPDVVMDYYNALIADRENATIEQKVSQNGTVQTVSGTKEALIDEVQLYDIHSKPIEFVEVSQDVILKIRVKVNAAIESMVIGFLIKDRLSQDVYGTNTHHLGKIVYDAKQAEVYEYLFRFKMNLGVGSYSVTAAVHAGESHVAKNYEWIDRAFIFNVVNAHKPNFVGTAWLDTDVEVKNV